MLQWVHHWAKWIAIHTTVIATVCGLCAFAHAQQPVVEKLVMADTIQPVTAGELKRVIDKASSDGAAAVLLELNTPGGLLDSTREMVGNILSSRVPVIVYIAPAGARGGSAGFFLLESADVAAMAPGTNAGAAHPVGGSSDETMKLKVANDAKAFLRSYVTKRNRNAEAAEAAVESSHSYTAEEALTQHLIDLTAASDQELLAALDGKEITRLDGTKITLHLHNARIEVIEPELRERLLGWLVDPNVALLLLMGGALLIYLEFHTPGTIVPGALGTLLLLLGIFALGFLPIRFTAVLLIVAALVFFALEAKIGGHGALAITGVVCLTLGTLTLVAAPVPEMSVSIWTALAVGLSFGGITIFLMRLAMRSRKMKTRLGQSALIGRVAQAMEPLTPEGHVLVEGEIWQAMASTPAAEGSSLRVVGNNEYLLYVEPENGPHFPNSEQ